MEALKDVIKKEITDMFDQILNYTSIAVVNKERYLALRGKILGLGNDCIRDIHKEIDDKYYTKERDADIPTT